MSEWEVTGDRRSVVLTGCVVDIGGGIIGIDVNGRGVGRQVDVTGAAVDNVSVGEAGSSGQA